MTRRPARCAVALFLPFPLLFFLLGLPGLSRGLSAGPLSTVGALPPSTLVLRVYYETISDIDRLARYDVWEFNNTKEKYVLISADSDIMTELMNAGWRVSIDEQRTASVRRLQEPSLFFAGYRTVDELYSDLSQINAAFPALTELVDYGDSYCKGIGGCVTPGGDLQPGYDLLAMRVTNEAIPGGSTLSGTAVLSGSKPLFFLMANLHAREISTPELAMRMLDWLTAGYGEVADATWLVDWHEIWIVPTANPDGHWLVELGESSPYGSYPFFQRKNSNQSNGCNTWPPTVFSQYGVDLNRNHSFAWGGVGSTAFPCDQAYRGLQASSEPEVQQLQALIRQMLPDQRGQGIADPAPADTRGILITIHSFSNLVLWPWGHTSLPAPNYTGLKAIGDKLASFNGYLSCQPNDCLYQASGTTDDWAYGELGIPAFTFEVGQDDFMPPLTEIESLQWPENAPAFQYAARIAAAPYRLVAGPDVTAISAFSVGSWLSVTAVIDDRLNGNRPAAAAMIAVDTPFWVSGAISYTLTAADASFDSAVEKVTALIDLQGTTQGTHMFFFQGMDADGNWGPVSAISVVLRDGNTRFFPLVLRD